VSGIRSDDLENVAVTIATQGVGFSAALLRRAQITPQRARRLGRRGQIEEDSRQVESVDGYRQRPRQSPAFTIGNDGVRRHEIDLPADVEGGDAAR
jgi:hypothetical protein